MPWTLTAVVAQLGPQHTLAWRIDGKGLLSCVFLHMYGVKKVYRKQMMSTYPIPSYVCSGVQKTVSQQTWCEQASKQQHNASLSLYCLLLSACSLFAAYNWLLVVPLPILVWRSDPRPIATQIQEHTLTVFTLHITIFNRIQMFNLLVILYLPRV